MQIKELGKAKAVLGERETFCYGQLEPCQGGKPTHEVIWVQWRAYVSSMVLSAVADLRFVAPAVPSTTEAMVET